jgi:cytochrome c biogenesis protein CcmG/thiol:disulfide interchange protein DsbE
MTDSPPASPSSKWLKRLPAIAFFVLAAGFYFRTVSYSAPSRVEIASLALENLDGSTFAPQTTEGKAVLVNFWAPWCGPCRSEMPTLQRLQSQHPDLVVIGIEDDPDEYRNAGLLASSTGISFPLVRTSNSVHSTFGHVVMLPTTLYISRSGKVLHAVSGVIPEFLMTRYTNEALAAN